MERPDIDIDIVTPDQYLRRVRELTRVETFEHAVAGLASETGELATLVKRTITSGRPPRRSHVAEELGDVLFYTGMGANTIGLSLGTLMSLTLKKLDRRRIAGKDKPVEHRMFFAHLDGDDE